jgi:hypothetical protein
MAEYVSTAEVVRALEMRDCTAIYQRLSKYGDLYGVVPERACNKRLRWPAAAVRELQRRLLVGERL